MVGGLFVFIHFFIARINATTDKASAARLMINVTVSMGYFSLEGPKP